MILEQIKQANINAMKQKDTLARSFFSVLLNKIKLLEIAKRQTQETVSDNDIIAILQKQIKELGEEKENYKKVNNAAAVLEIERQEEIVNMFLPQMMSENEIEEIIKNMDDKSLPAIMKKFKAEFAGKCDMRLVNQVAKKF